MNSEAAETAKGDVSVLAVTLPPKQKRPLWRFFAVQSQLIIRPFHPTLVWEIIK